MPLIVEGTLLSANTYVDGRGEERGKVTVQTSSEVIRPFGCAPVEAKRLVGQVGKSVRLPFLITERNGKDGTRYTFVDLVPNTGAGV